MIAEDVNATVNGAAGAIANSTNGAASEHESTPTVGYDQLFYSLARNARVFPLKSDEITLLPSPTSFYEQLLASIGRAKRRITLSSLYLGTGKLEKQLVAAMAQQMRAFPELQVQIVLDYSRGQRGGQTNSSVTMLKELLVEFPNQFQLFLYKVPQLKGFKASLPPPFNETIGVSHAKVYLCDDTLVLSGANLSDDYFTNRQDRYVQMANCGGLGDFYHQFVCLIACYSFRVQMKPGSKSGKYELVGSSNNSDAENQAMKQACEELLSSSRHPQDAFFTTEHTSEDGEVKYTDNDAWAIPTIQFTPIDVTNDEVLLSRFIQQLPANSSLRIASGYLNFPSFLGNLLTKCHAHLDVLLAAPIANGFYNANGVKGALPMAYSLIEQEFYNATHNNQRPNYTTILREFNRPGWTFHGKGMWWSPAADKPPQITIFGSSNFGCRSYGTDLESQVFLYTKNPKLQQQLCEEYDALTKHTEVVTDQLWKRPERNMQGLFSWKSGHWIRPVAKIISAYL